MGRWMSGDSRLDKILTATVRKCQEVDMITDFRADDGRKLGVGGLFDSARKVCGPASSVVAMHFRYALGMIFLFRV